MTDYEPTDMFSTKPYLQWLMSFRLESGLKTRSVGFLAIDQVRVELQSERPLKKSVRKKNTENLISMAYKLADGRETKNTRTPDWFQNQ